MEYFKIIICTILEKIYEYSFKYKISVSLFTVISVNPLFGDIQALDIVNSINFLEDLSGKTPSVKKIFFKKNSNYIKFIINSSNINKIFYSKIFLFVSFFKKMQEFFKLSSKISYFLNLNKLILKYENIFLFTNLYGNSDKDNKNLCHYDLYIIFTFNNNKIFNYHIKNIFI